MTSKCGVPASWRRQLGGTLKVQVEHLAQHVSTGGNFLGPIKQAQCGQSGIERGRGRQVMMGLKGERRAAVLERRGRYFSRPAQDWAADLGVPVHAVIQFRNDFADKWVPGESRQRA